MMMHMPMFVLDQLFNDQDANLSGCPPGFCRPSARASARACAASGTNVRTPKAQAKSPAPQPSAQQPVDVVRSANHRELSDSYLIWADLPGLAREDIKVTIEDDVLRVTGRQKAHAADDKASKALQAALRARPRRGVDIRVPLKSDTKLDAIHAKLNNGELTIVIPKRVPQHFSIPVMGGDEQPSSSASPAILSSTEHAAIEPAAETSETAIPANIAEVAYPDFLGTLQEAKQNAEEARVEASESAESDAATPAEAIRPASATPEAPESDGSWEDVSDEEREAERSARRRKGPLPPNGPVLEEIAQESASSS